MAPGPKKKSFHTPRNTKNAPVTKPYEKKTNETCEAVDVSSNLSSDSNVNKKNKYSKRTLESNWTKYDEPVNDPHADSTRGEDFEVLLSYSGGSGSQLKLQDEKEWEDEYVKDISLHIPDLINAVKCMPFHERMGVQNIFDEKTVLNFIEISKKCELSYKSQPKAPISESNPEVATADPVLNIIEESEAVESDEDMPIKNFTVEDKTEDIINSLASNLSFRNFSENEEIVEVPPEKELPEEKKPESASNDLDFLLSLNISSKIPAKKETTTITPKNSNVDDWLNSILDD